jgi:cell filamentation protein
MTTLARDRYAAEGVESEFEPGSRGRVLRNRLGIRRVREMQLAESVALLEVQRWALEHFSATHRFTADDLCVIHKQWLGDIYEWAGHYRTVNIGKGGLMFAAASQLPRLMQSFERDELKRFTPCRGFNTLALAGALARTHAELVLIHPFREGNGRCSRILCTLMALQADFPPLDFSPLAGRGRAAYFAAIRSALDRKYEPLETCFTRVIARTLRAHAAA